MLRDAYSSMIKKNNLLCHFGTESWLQEGLARKGNDANILGMGEIEERWRREY